MAGEYDPAALDLNNKINHFLDDCEIDRSKLTLAEDIEHIIYELSQERECAFAEDVDGNEYLIRIEAFTRKLVFCLKKELMRI